MIRPHGERLDVFDRLFGLEKLGIKFGLENIRSLAAALGNPQREFVSIIVAGTNGKGSVSATLEIALRLAGHRTAHYTSPHLVRLEERFSIGGQPVPTETLRTITEQVLDVADDQRTSGRLATSPTFFEVTTATAFELFRRARVEFAILEVGLGGRFDATNIVDPIAGAITSIDLDHERLLGHTIGEIALEKAGVVKPGMIIVVGEMGREAIAAVERVAVDRGARLVRAMDSVTTDVRIEDGRTRMSLATPRTRYRAVTMALRGRHQVRNAIVAVRLLEELNAAGVLVASEHIAASLEQVTWRGRLDLVQLGPDRALLIDAAHNPAGAAALAAYVGEVYPDGLPFVFGAMRDKDTAGMLSHLLRIATRLVMTKPRNERAADPHDLARQAIALAPRVPVEVELDPTEAVDHALRFGRTACVAGSIFLAGEVYARLQVSTPEGRGHRT
ncbi:MAG: hypothetical protein HYX76_04240 [Acidobacteria bacterium]|nr:hypothetical protein [Acidobacteriota bacterium]